MKKSSEKIDIISRIQAEDTFILYCYAPICANCRIAEKMLDIVAEMKNFSYTAVDLNYEKELIETYQIRSAPALLLFKNGELKEEIYAFHSVPHLTEKLEEFFVDA